MGTALAALSAAVSMIIDTPEEGIAEVILIDYLSHAGQMMSDVFHQQSIARKSFITPQMDKSRQKPTVDEMVSDEWLYEDNLVEKNATEIERACAQIEDKTKKDTFKTQRNSKYPSATYKQARQTRGRRVLKTSGKFFQRNSQHTFQKPAQSTQTKTTPTTQSVPKK